MDGNLIMTVKVTVPGNNLATEVLEAQPVEREVSLLQVGGISKESARQIVQLVQRMNPGLNFGAQWIGNVDLINPEN